MANSKAFFNLSKFAQSESSTDGISSDFSMPNNSEDVSDTDVVVEGENEILFETPEDLKKLMDSNKDNPDFVNQVLEITPENSQSFVKDSLQRYYEPERDEADRTIISAEIYKEIHGRGKGEQEVEAIYTKASVESLVRESSQNIANFAKEAAARNANKKTAKSFNLKKQAQFHGIRSGDFLTYGPDDRAFFPYSNTGYVGSRWHTWLRGRDHNFLFDELPVDFEAFWRGNIMDKYSRPYRNEKGEYVGGYINKRFEVDRNIPEGNNLQLLPGQKRRPYMPEWATLEARMTAARGKHAEERGYSPFIEQGEANNPYAFKAASVKKK